MTEAHLMESGPLPGSDGRPRNPGALSATGAWGLTLLGVAMLAFIFVTQDPILRGALMALGAVACGVGFFGLAVRLDGVSGSEDPAAALHTIIENADYPAAFSDNQGWIFAANDPARGLVGAISRPGAALMTGDAPNGQEIAYRLLTAAWRDGTAREVLRGGADHGWVEYLSADRMGESILWRVVREGFAPEAVDEKYGQGEVAFARVSQSGVILFANAAMRDLIGEAGTVDAAFEPLSVEAASDRSADLRMVRRRWVRQPDGGRQAVMVMEAALPQGAAIYVFPESLTGASMGSAIYHAAPIALARLSLEGEFVDLNDAAQKLLGEKAKSGVPLGDLLEGLGRTIEARVADAAEGRSNGRMELSRTRDDDEVFIQMALSRIEIDREPSLVAVLTDATALKTLEEQFVQSQKIQAVGQLAGGVAHDFNNILTAISGHCDLLLLGRDDNDADFADLSQINQNANRAAALVRQLLAFSRQQTLRPTAVLLSDVLSDISHMLNRLLGERVKLVFDHADDIGLVMADERQFEQVIMNLVVNARDAMPMGGEVRVMVRNFELKEEMRRDRAVVPVGDYVMVQVSDQGEGIPADKLPKIFEPFYTTKAQGEGTGLGLSTAYGIIKQTGGYIFADSAPGAGALFTILLPRYDGPAPVVVEQAPEDQDLTGEGLVLLVEDEDPVRAFASRALDMRGYTVLEAASGEEALTILEGMEEKVDVMISDVVMPGIDGPTWVREARERYGDARVIFVSGYAEDSFRKNLGGLTDFVFLPKPYSLQELTSKVKEAMQAK